MYVVNHTELSESQSIHKYKSTETGLNVVYDIWRCSDLLICEGITWFSSFPRNDWKRARVELDSQKCKTPTTHVHRSVWITVTTLKKFRLSSHLANIHPTSTHAESSFSNHVYNDVYSTYWQFFGFVASNYVSLKT